MIGQQGSTQWLLIGIYPCWIFGLPIWLGIQRRHRWQKLVNVSPSRWAVLCNMMEHILAHRLPRICSWSFVLSEFITEEAIEPRSTMSIPKYVNSGPIIATSQFDLGFLKDKSVLITGGKLKPHLKTQLMSTRSKRSWEGLRKSLRWCRVRLLFICHIAKADFEVRLSRLETSIVKLGSRQHWN